jgi:hypothetical protein
LEHDCKRSDGYETPIDSRQGAVHHLRPGSCRPYFYLVYCHLLRCPLLRGKDKHIAALQERIEQLKKGTTPQTDGLEFEDRLTSGLQREFPDDRIMHKGKTG